MKRYIVIGCGRFGSSLACTLNSLGEEVLVIDIHDERIRKISGKVTRAIQADITDEDVLMDLDVGKFDMVIVSIGSNYRASIMATLMAKELGVDRVIAKACSLAHGKVLSKVGADKIIYPERDMGIRVAHNLASSNVLDFIELSPDYSILEVTALERWEDRTLKELGLPSKYGINIMAIKRGKDINVSPYADDIIYKDDILVVIGNTSDVKRIERGVD
ncbi:MAG: TrkA family potassium uptake protein [Tissierellia bacterium]|nr:TrkA family potassium uptake protein [Tissierellia bacterium]